MESTAQVIELPTDAGQTIALDERRGRAVDFYELTKPRMNLLVVITTLVGFYMASRTGVQWLLLMHTLIGTALSAASASVFNQLIERHLDALMPRTRNRPLPAGKVQPAEALIFGSVLGICGVAYLALLVNPLTALLAAFTHVSYIGIYTPMKRVSSLNTLIGAVPGAIPPMMGFTAVDNEISAAAVALFGILFFWQMPHFLAIAVLFRSDYAAAGFKMLPNIHEGLTGRQIILHTLALIPVSLLPTFLGNSGSVYFFIAILLGAVFLSYGITAAVSRTRSDARKLFFASIIYLPLLLAAMMVDKM